MFLKLLKHAVSVNGSEAGFINLKERDTQILPDKNIGSSHNLSVITNFGNELGMTILLF